MITVTSFGYGHGTAPAADIVLDVRHNLRNPHHDPAMRQKNGLDPDVGEHVLTTPGALRIVDDTIRQVLTGQVAGIAVGCVGGRHRSVALAQEIGNRLAGVGRDVDVVHRDVDKPVLKPEER